PVLAGPVEAVPRRDLHLVRDRLFRVADVVVDRTRGVGEYVSGELAVLVPQHRGAGAQPEVGNLGQGDLRSVHGGDTNAPQSVQIRSEVPRVADGHRVPLAAFDRGGNGQPADRSLDGVLDVADV